MPGRLLIGRDRHVAGGVAGRWLLRPLRRRGALPSSHGEARSRLEGGNGCAAGSCTGPGVFVGQEDRVVGGVRLREGRRNPLSVPRCHLGSRLEGRTRGVRRTPGVGGGAARLGVPEVQRGPGGRGRPRTRRSKVTGRGQGPGAQRSGREGTDPGKVGGCNTGKDPGAQGPRLLGGRRSGRGGPEKRGLLLGGGSHLTCTSPPPPVSL